MSNAKIRARRRRRARRAWDKTTGFVHYYDIETAVVTMGDTRPRTNAERQAEGAADYMRELSKLIAERYPGMLQIHDCLMVDVAAPDGEKVADSVKNRMTEVLRNWHKDAGFGVDFALSRWHIASDWAVMGREKQKNLRPSLVDFGDPVSFDDTSEHLKDDLAL